MTSGAYSRIASASCQGVGIMPMHEASKELPYPDQWSRFSDQISGHL